MADLRMRHGTTADADWLLELFDEAVEWMVARGQPEQWGDQPFSTRPAAVERIQKLASGGGLRVAELDGAPVGALAVGKAPDHVPPAHTRELYILLVLTSRRHSGRQIGSLLIQAAVAEAKAKGAALIRVDCWAGAPSLINWYRRQGFTPSDTFDLDGWAGQVFAMPIAVTDPDSEQGGGP